MTVAERTITPTPAQALTPREEILAEAGMCDVHKAIARRFVEDLWNRAQLDIADEIFSSTCVPHTYTYTGDSDRDGDSEARRGPQHIKAIVAGWRRAFPDWHIRIEDMLAEGDRVMLLTTGAGTHRGPLMGISPTGRRVMFTGMRVLRFENQRIVEYWVLWDWQGLWRQLGRSPSSSLARTTAAVGGLESIWHAIQSADQLTRATVRAMGTRNLGH
jgi:predicted ester cyclase